MTVATTVAFVVVVVGAAAADLRTGRIPNWWVLAGTALAFVLRAFDGVTPLLEGLLGVGVAFAITLPLFALGALGGGDAKLLMAVGAFMGPGRLVGAMLVIAVIGGIVALLEALRRGIPIAVLVRAKQLLQQLVRGGRDGTAPRLDSPDAITVPYGVAIAIGSLVWWVWGGTLL